MAGLTTLKRFVPAPLRPAVSLGRRALAAYGRRLIEFVMGDRRLLERQYLAQFGYKLNLDDPKTFNEKVHWRKLYDRDPLHPAISDKVAVRDYVSSRIGAEYLVPILGIFRDPEEIPWADLSAPYVIKPSHSSGQVAIVHDSAEVDPSKMVPMLKDWLRTDHYRARREWAYKSVPRRLVFERFVGVGNRAPDDFKFYCFDGEPRVVQANYDRYTHHTVTFYDASWEVLPVECEVEKGPERPAPSCLPDMLRVSGELSREIDFVRVDLFCVDGKVYFGELTLYPAAGFGFFYPSEWDRRLGDMWNLPHSGSKHLRRSYHELF